MKTVVVDDWLMKQISRGNKESFKMLVNRNQEYVLRIAYRFLGNWQDSEDAAQEVFLKLFINAKKYKSQGKFHAFIARVTTNECLNRLRRNKHLLHLEDEFVEVSKYSSPDKIYEQNELKEDIQEALVQLPERQRIAFLMKIYGNFSYTEIGKNLGCSRIAIEGLIFRARQKLQQKLKPLLKEKWSI